ncbi:hypothetical protein HPB48_023041 [Haemaphysalis longicornis]|uniref:Sulfotransferase n=1 Tax=Haemaphysalis longicornis TaxID=44386 RepID=A0A9J6G894_HAELO|nr:hypothetical protein HPB48_023041 [Haemaphysalis longicornis]
MNKSSSPRLNNDPLGGRIPRLFQAALEAYPVLPPGEVNIVFVVSYYRSGSSFVGELLSSGPMTFFHFEPLMIFTVNDRISPGRERYAFDLLDELVMCQMENIPLYMVFFEQRPRYVLLNRFLADVCGAGEACFSHRHVASLCTRAKAQVFKFTRLHISQVCFSSGNQLSPVTCHFHEPRFRSVLQAALRTLPHQHVRKISAVAVPAAAWCSPVFWSLISWQNCTWRRSAATLTWRQTDKNHSRRRFHSLGPAAA